jgi:hypothetical protein
MAGLTLGYGTQRIGSNVFHARNNVPIRTTSPSNFHPNLILSGHAIPLKQIKDFRASNSGFPRLSCISEAFILKSIAGKAFAGTPGSHDYKFVERGTAAS